MISARHNSHHAVLLSLSLTFILTESVIMCPQIQPSRPAHSFSQSSAQPTFNTPCHRWLTATEAAHYLGIKPRTLLLWARQGRIRACALTGTKRHVWRFSLSDLEAFITHNQPVVISAQPSVPCAKGAQ